MTLKKAAFERVVISACDGAVEKAQVHALILDLGDLLDEDGIDKRAEMISRTVAKPEHQQEVLRVAALLAHVSGGVSAEEQQLLEKLCTLFRLSPEALGQALSEAESALAD